jgi:hypothetical protein
MEPERSFVLQQDSKLFAVSRTSREVETEEIFYTTAEEAVISLFHSEPGHWTRTAVSEVDYYLKVYSVRRDLTISDRAPFEMRQLAIRGDPSEESFSLNLQRQCPMNATGYWLEVPVSVPTDIDGNDEIVSNRMSNVGLTGFVLCSPGSLLHIRRLRLDVASLLNAIFAKQELFRQQGLELNASKLADMIKDTLSKQSQEYLDIIPLTTERISELPAAAQRTGLTPGLPIFAQSRSLQSAIPRQTLSSAQKLSPVLSPAEVSFDPSSLDSLPKDLIVYMAMGMSLDTIWRFCRTSNRLNDLVCDNERFWVDKLANEFPGEAEKKPSDSTFREHYQKTWMAAKDPYAVLQIVNKIKKGFHTVQLVGILLELSSKRPADIAAGIPSKMVTARYILELIGITGGFHISILSVYPRWFKHTNPDLPLFSDGRANPPYAPLNKAAEKIEQIRGTIYDAVVAYMSVPAIMQRLENPPVPAGMLAGPVSTPWQKMRKVLLAMGLDTKSYRSTLGVADANTSVAMGAFYKAAFQRAWSLTQRDVEPPRGLQ